MLTTRHIGIIQIALLFFIQGYAKCFPDESQNEKAGLFATQMLLEMELYMPWDSLLIDVGEDPGYHEGTLVYYDSTGRRNEIIVEARARGHFRKNPDNCNFPPLKLKFKKKNVAGTVFEGLKRIDMVNHCQNENLDYEQYVLQEYLIYQTYSLYTPLSFKTRLARVHYLDVHGPKDTLTRFAFFVENPEDMASRNDGEFLELESAQQDKLDQDQLALMAIFNYMIINTDYSIPIMHNVVLVSRDYFEPPLPVPYDFDWSGLINIPYDSPYVTYIGGSPQRAYKGPCLKMKELLKILSKMELKRLQVFTLFVEFPYLDDEKKSRNIQDLHLFYILSGNTKLIREAFIMDCQDN
jgi:hypothetical protein